MWSYYHLKFERSLTHDCTKLRNTARVPCLSFSIPTASRCGFTWKPCIIVRTYVNLLCIENDVSLQRCSFDGSTARHVGSLSVRQSTANRIYFRSATDTCNERRDKNSKTVAQVATLIVAVPDTTPQTPLSQHRHSHTAQGGVRI